MGGISGRRTTARMDEPDEPDWPSRLPSIAKKLAILAVGVVVYVVLMKIVFFGEPSRMSEGGALEALSARATVITAERPA
jgi:hypothetical protein